MTSYESSPKNAPNQENIITSSLSNGKGGRNEAEKALTSCLAVLYGYITSEIIWRGLYTSSFRFEWDLANLLDSDDTRDIDCKRRIEAYCQGESLLFGCGSG
jgi:hypothetical protein